MDTTSRDLRGGERARVSDARDENQELDNGLTEDDLWRSIMPRGDDGRVVLLLERGGSEVDQTSVGVFQDMSLRTSFGLASREWSQSQFSARERCAKRNTERSRTSSSTVQ